jgi:hydrogenase-1 operon protein HyaE
MDTAVAAPPLHPLLARFCSELDAPTLDPDAYDAWAGRPGHALVFFSEDPVTYRETLDLAVIVPELARAFAGRFRAALLLPDAARTISARYGFRRWPAIVLLRDGAYVGAIDGLRDWSDYTDELARLLDAEPTRPPSIGIAVTTAGAGHAPGCH